MIGALGIRLVRRGVSAGRPTVAACSVGLDGTSHPNAGPHCPKRLVGVGAFALVLEHLAGPGVDAHFERLAGALDIERVAQAGPAAFPLELLVGDLAGARSDLGRSRLSERGLGPR